MNVNWTGVFRIAWRTSRRTVGKLTAKPTHKTAHNDPLAPLGQLSTLGAIGVAFGIFAMLAALAAAALIIPNLEIQP